MTGYSNPAFDTACAAAYWALPDQPDYAARSQAAERLFAEELPVIPLYYQLKIAISRPDLCGLDLDVTARSLLVEPGSAGLWGGVQVEKTLHPGHLLPDGMKGVKPSPIGAWSG